MKIIYVNDKNALDFDKQNKNNIVFAKYFSPGCPACISMKTEWDDMCKDIDEKYNTDLILAQIDPDGMSELENTKTYSDVSYVPSIVILKNGEKVDEYNGPKNKEDMIDFLLKGKYLRDNMKGGSKSSKMKKSKKKHKTGRKKNTSQSQSRRRKRGNKKTKIKKYKPHKSLSSLRGFL